MNWLWELLFCPQHGLIAMVPLLQQLRVAVQGLWLRLPQVTAWVRRFI